MSALSKKKKEHPTVRQVLQQIFGKDVGNYIISFVNKNYFDVRSFVYSYSTDKFSDCSHCGVFQVLKDCDHNLTGINMSIIRIGGNKPLYQDIMDLVKNTEVSFKEGLLYLSVKHKHVLYDYKGMSFQEAKSYDELDVHPHYQKYLENGHKGFFYYYDKDGSLVETKIERNNGSPVNHVKKFSQGREKIRRKYKLFANQLNWKWVIDGETDPSVRLMRNSNVAGVHTL